MDSSRTHRVRFLLPDKTNDLSDRSWMDGDEMRNRFELKLSKLVVPPPPKLNPQLMDPEELLIELKRKLMAIDRTIQFKDVILEEEEEDFEDSHPKIQAPEILSENNILESDSLVKRQPIFEEKHPPTQDQLVLEKQPDQEIPQTSDEPNQQFLNEKLPEQLPRVKQSNESHSPNLTHVGPKRPPLPPTKRIQASKDGSKDADARVNISRQDSLPRSFKTRRRSFRDFSKRQFHRALSAMNISRSGGQEQKLLKSNSIDAKIDSISTDSTSGLQHDNKRIRSKSSSSNSLLLVSNIRSKFQRFPSNSYKKSIRENSSEQRGLEPLKRRSSWSKLFSSWSSNLQSCTRVQTDD